MKRFAISFFALLPFLVFAQVNDHSDIIKIKGETVTDIKSTKNALWQNAQTWSDALSTEYNKKVDTKDKENGTIILKIETYLQSNVVGMTEFSKIKVMMNLKIDCRDNKYRTIFSNFTSIIDLDRNANINNLDEYQLRKMVVELERIAYLSKQDFNEEVIWDIDKVLSAKNKYILSNKEHQSVISQQDEATKKGLKEVKIRNLWIEGNNQKIAFLDFILTGFAMKIDKIKAEINKSMGVKDDF